MNGVGHGLLVSGTERIEVAQDLARRKNVWSGSGHSRKMGSLGQELVTGEKNNELVTEKILMKILVRC